MKTNLVITIIMLFFFNCDKKEPGLTAPQQAAAPKEEITDAVNRIFQGLEKMDAEALFESYLNSSDFILFTTNGSMLNFPAAKNENAQWFNSLSNLDVTTVKNECRFLSGDIAICTWLGYFDVVLKTGGDLRNNIGITFVFKKTNDKWLVVYQQTSELPS